MSKPNEIKPFSLRVKEDLDKLHIKPESVDLTISSFKKSFNTPEIYKEKFLKFIEEHKDYTKLYTDGSKDGSKVGCSVFEKQFSAKVYQMTLLCLQQKLKPLIWPCHIFHNITKINLLFFLIHFLF